MTFNSKDRVYNFSAGPGALPLEVLEEVHNEIPVYRTTGTTIMEVSHRSPAYTGVVDSARELFRSLLGLTDDWHILFLQGGASLQFYQVPLNFLGIDGVADYLNTGAWSTKAIKEARRIGKVNIAASSEESNFNYIPAASDWVLSDQADYLHYTSNNTIYGTQFDSEPWTNAPLVCDASSDFMSRPLDIDRYGLIYAGAQKNIGPAGCTVVLVKDSFLQKRDSDLPTLLDYGTHTAKLFHTPPVFAVYIIEKVLRWLDRLGGIPAVQQLNDEKARRLYATIDGTDFYTGTAEIGSRSKMNVTFRLLDESLEPVFLEEAMQAGLHALKGYRTVGGVRASIYNACTLEAVDALTAFMHDFERRRG